MSNLALRLLTAAVLVPLTLWLLYQPNRDLFFGGWLIVTVLAAFELLSMVLPGRRLLQMWGGALAVGWLLVLRYAPTAEAMLSLVIVTVVVPCVVLAVRPRAIESAALALAWLLAGPIYVGGLCAATAALHRLDQGAHWVVLAMTIAFLGDTAAYFVGRRFGKRPLAPLVSPGKTIEGAVGGLLGSILAVVVAHFSYLPALPLGSGLALAVLAGASGQAGDLCESLIKRHAGFKDSGKILPGHGGILDRIDGLLVAAAITWLYSQWCFV